MVELLEVDAAVLRMPDPRREQLLPLALHVAQEQLLAPRALDPLPPAAVRRRRDPAVVPGRRADRPRCGRGAGQLGGSHSLLVPFLEKGSTAAIVPIATPAEVLASLTLLSLAPDRPVDRQTIDAALSISGQAALAIDNARLYQAQKDFADAMRRSLLPQVRPAVEGLDIGEVYAASARLEIGGDLYDYIALDDGRLAVVLGDVTGHGIDAAADMAMAKFVFRSLVREHPEPSDFLAAANEVVVGEIAPGKFITMLYLLSTPIGATSPSPPPGIRLLGSSARTGRSSASRRAASRSGSTKGSSTTETHAQLEPARFGRPVHGRRDRGAAGRRALRRGRGSTRCSRVVTRCRAEDIAASVIQSARGSPAASFLTTARSSS